MANPVGRPQSYKPEYAGQAKKLSELGLTDAQMADFFEVSIPTLNSWKGKHPEFFKSLKVGKKVAEDSVVRSLYLRAVGYEVHEDKIFNNNGEEMIVPTRKHIPADVGAIKMWLINRKSKDWKDKQDHDHHHDMTVKIESDDAGTL